MVEVSFDRDEFRPDPEDRRREAERREEREREMDRAFFEQQQRDEAQRQRERQDMERDAQESAIRRIVNDPDITIDETLRAVVNDPELSMDKDMVVRRKGRSITRGFRRDLLLPPLDQGKSKKRTRRKSKMDKLQAEALKQANAKLRKKNGQLRKGKTQADVMRLAHRIRKKMS